MDPSSKSKLVESGQKLFNKFGFRKVTVEEICRDAGVSKMTFYRFFTNKMDLVTHIISTMAAEAFKVYRDIMESETSFEEKIKATIQMKSETSELISEEFLKDIYNDPTGEVMTMLTKLSTETLAIVMEDYRKAQQNGQIRKDLNISFIPYYTNKIIEMVKDPELLNMYGGNRHEVIRELTGLFFYGIFPPKAPQKK